MSTQTVILPEPDQEIVGAVLFDPFWEDERAPIAEVCVHPGGVVLNTQSPELPLSADQAVRLGLALLAAGGHEMASR